MFELLSEPWWWVIGGLLLVLSEFAVPGFVVCFFGAAAIAVGALTGLFPELPMGAKLLIFGVGGLLLMLAFRRFMPQAFRGKRQLATDDPDEDELAGSRAVVAAAIDPERPGKVDFRGTLWTARAAAPLAVGTPVRVVRRDNLELVVEALSDGQAS